MGDSSDEPRPKTAGDTPVVAPAEQGGASGQNFGPLIPLIGAEAAGAGADYAEHAWIQPGLEHLQSPLFDHAPVAEHQAVDFAEQVTIDTGLVAIVGAMCLWLMGRRRRKA